MPPDAIEESFEETPERPNHALAILEVEKEDLERRHRIRFEEMSLKKNSYEESARLLKEVTERLGDVDDAIASIQNKESDRG